MSNQESSEFSCPHCDFKGKKTVLAQQAHFRHSHLLEYCMRIGDKVEKFQRSDRTAKLVCPEATCDGWSVARWETFRLHMQSKHSPPTNHVGEPTAPPLPGADGKRLPSDNEHIIQPTSAKRRRSQRSHPIPFNAASAPNDRSEIQEHNSDHPLAGGTKETLRPGFAPPPDVYSGDETDKPSKRPRSKRPIVPPTVMDSGVSSGCRTSPELNECTAHTQEAEALDGSISYLHSDKILDGLGLRFHKHYKVLICLACAVSFTPDELPGHLKTHKLKLTTEQLAYISSSPVTLGVRTEPGVDSLPNPGGPPVEGLTTQLGYGCNFCSYACVKMRTMADHHKIHKDDHRHASPNSRSHPASVQTFRSSTKRIFFEVQPALSGVPSTTIWNSFLRDEASRPAEELSAVPPLRATEVPLLLKHTQWHTHLGDRIKERKDREILLDMTTLPNTSSGPLGSLLDLSKAYISKAAEIGLGADQYVLQMLEEFPVLSLESKRWTIHEAPGTVEQYGRSLARFIHAALISMKASKEAYRLPLCKESFALGSALWDELEKPLPGDKSEAKKALERKVPVLHPFLWKLFSTRPAGLRATRWDDPIEAYLPLRFLLRDGNFAAPIAVTPELAHWKYLIRSSAMLEAWNTKDHFQGDLIAATRKICEENFCPAAQSPFVSIARLQSKATSLAHSQTARPQITVAPDVKAISVHGRKLHLDTWRAGLQRLMDDAESELDRLCRGRKWAITIPENLVDDQTNEERGHGWLNSGPFTKEVLPLMKVLLEDPERPVAKQSLDDKLQWIPANVIAFMQDSASFVEKLATLNHKVPSPGLRGVEFLDCKIRNSTACRNFYHDHGDDVFIATRTKPDGPRDATSYIPIFIPPRLQELIRRYLIIVRPVEERFAELLWGKDARTLYYEYMYITMGAPMAPRFSTILQRIMSKYAGIEDIGLQRYRQLSVAIKREFIRPEYDTENDFDDTSDEVSGHGTGMAILQYANQHGYHPTLTTDRLLRYRVFCVQWWNVTGFGSGPPPIPLRLRSINSSRAALNGNADVSPAMGSLLNTEAITNVVRDAIVGQMLHFQSNLEGIIHKVVSEVLKPILSAATPTAAPPERDWPGDVGQGDPNEPDTVLTGRDKQRSTFEDATAPSPLHLDGDAHLQVDVSQPASLDLDAGPSLPLHLDGDAHLQVDVSQPASLDLDAGPSLPSHTHLTSIGPSSQSDRGRISDDFVRERLRETLGVPDADFTCPQQAELIRQTLLKERNVIGVLPTGSGKSMAWLVPAKIASEKVTIVIVPNEALLRDHLETAQRLGIPAHHWTVKNQEYGMAKVIFVAVESMASPAFKTFYRSEETKIGRIIFDEGHLLTVAAEYRPRMNKYKDLAVFPVQRIVLSATIPPAMLPMLLEQCTLPDSTLVIRAPSFRPLIRYHTVKLTQLAHLPPLEYTLRLAEMLERQVFKSDSRGIIYVREKSEAVKLSSNFKNCTHYSTLYAGEKKENERRWTRGESKWIVATSGFAEGINRPFVDAVIIVGIPHSFLDLVQCPGRGGRAGRPSMAFMVNDCSIQYVVGDESVDDPQLCRELMEWQCNDVDCIRLLLSRVVDGDEINCAMVTDAEVCSRCDPNTELYRAAIALRVPAAPEEELDEYDEAISSGWPDMTQAEWEAINDTEAKALQMTPGKVSLRLAQPHRPERTDAAPPRALHTTDASNLSQVGLRSATQTTTSSFKLNQAKNSISKQPKGKVHSSYSRHSGSKDGSGLPETCGKGFSSVEEDAAKARQGLDVKKAKSVKLSRIMQFLELCCPICWACIGHVDHNHALAKASKNGIHQAYVDCAGICGTGSTIPSYGWMNVKGRAAFKPYAYCYGCHLPQRPIMPDCHQGHPFCKNCPFSDIIAHVVWVIRHMPKFWIPASNHFKLAFRITEDKYGDWLAKERNQRDSFHNGIELVLWFVEQYRPEILGGSG